MSEAQLQPGQEWKHKRTRGIYSIVTLAKLEATLDDVVIYSGATGTWVRPLAEFCEKFEWLERGDE